MKPSSTWSWHYHIEWLMTCKNRWKVAYNISWISHSRYNHKANLGPNANDSILDGWENCTKVPRYVHEFNATLLRSHKQMMTAILCSFVSRETPTIIWISCNKPLKILQERLQTITIIPTLSDYTWMLISRIQYDFKMVYCKRIKYMR